MSDIFASIRSRNATGLVAYFWAVMYMTEKKTLRNLFLHVNQHLSRDKQETKYDFPFNRSFLVTYSQCIFTLYLKFWMIVFRRVLGILVETLKERISQIPWVCFLQVLWCWNILGKKKNWILCHFCCFVLMLLLLLFFFFADKLRRFL